MKEFGSVNGQTAHLYEICGKGGMKAEISEFGATIVSLFVPDHNKTLRDVVCGYDSAADYAKNTCYFGATIGRNANRIANAQVEINGMTYKLDVNDNENNLHSGHGGLHARFWQVKEQKENSITLGILDKAFDDDFPGDLDLTVTFTILDSNALEIVYNGKSDADTICNLTNHSYFNLNGHQRDSILKHVLQINGSYYTPVQSSKAIPTGALESVEDTPFDFRKAKPVGRDIEVENTQLTYGHGYDHNYVIDDTLAPQKEGLKKAAELSSEESGITMSVWTDCIGIQLYTGNFIGGQRGKGNVFYMDRGALALETQFYPNAAGEKNFPSPILKKGQEYHSRTIYSFLTK